MKNIIKNSIYTSLNGSYFNEKRLIFLNEGPEAGPGKIQEKSEKEKTKEKAVHVEVLRNVAKAKTQSNCLEIIKATRLALQGLKSQKSFMDLYTKFNRYLDIAEKKIRRYPSFVNRMSKAKNKVRSAIDTALAEYKKRVKTHFPELFTVKPKPSAVAQKQAVEKPEINLDIQGKINNVKTLLVELQDKINQEKDPWKYKMKLRYYRINKKRLDRLLGDAELLSRKKYANKMLDLITDSIYTISPELKPIHIYASIKKNVG